MANSTQTFTYNSFSGCDIRATLGTTEIGNLQGISFTVTREKAPLYTMGTVNPRAFARGKRGIAGSLIFLTFDKDAFLQAAANWRGTLEWQNERQMGSAPGDDYVLENIATGRQYAQATYADQIMPFDITLRAVNEYGAGMQMKVLGVEVLNAGSGSSVDDITIDSNMTWVARELSPWTPLAGVQTEATLVRTIAQYQSTS